MLYWLNKSILVFSFFVQSSFKCQCTHPASIVILGVPISLTATRWHSLNYGGEVSAT